jgi:hypothetical protein
MGTDWLLDILFFVETDILSSASDFGSKKLLFSNADWFEGGFGFLSAVFVFLPCRKVRDPKGLLGGAQSGYARAALSVRKYSSYCKSFIRFSNCGVVSSVWPNIVSLPCLQIRSASASDTAGSWLRIHCGRG